MKAAADKSSLVHVLLHHCLMELGAASKGVSGARRRGKRTNTTRAELQCIGGLQERSMP